MSEEEKFKIYLRILNEENSIDKKEEAMLGLLGLYYKQQTEIEELKEINADLVKTRIEDLQELNRIQQEDFISKNIIRAKINKLKEEVKQMEQADVGVGFTLGEEWSNKKITIQAYEELLEE